MTELLHADFKSKNRFSRENENGKKGIVLGFFQGVSKSLPALITPQQLRSITQLTSCFNDALDGNIRMRSRKSRHPLHKGCEQAQFLFYCGEQATSPFMILRASHERDYSDNGTLKTRYTLSDGFGRLAARTRIETHDFEQDIMPAIDKKIWDAMQLQPQSRPQKKLMHLG